MLLVLYITWVRASFATSLRSKVHGLHRHSQKVQIRTPCVHYTNRSTGRSISKIKLSSTIFVADNTWKGILNHESHPHPHPYYRIWFLIQIKMLKHGGDIFRRFYGKHCELTVSECMVNVLVSFMVIAEDHLTYSWQLWRRGARI